MKMTKQIGYSRLSEETKNKVNLMWIRANINNLHVELVGDTVIAHDKATKEILTTAKCDQDQIGLWKVMIGVDLDKSEEFNLELTGKPGEIMWYINPTFKRNKNGRDSMFMLIENIKQVEIKGFAGSNDTPISLRYIDINGDRSSAFQYAFFENLEDAIKVCKMTPVDGFDYWDEYMDVCKDLLKTRYTVDIHHNRGDELTLNKRYNTGDKIVTKANRYIIDSDKAHPVEIQTVAALFDRETNEYFIPEEEVQVTFDESTINSFGLTPKLRYKEHEVSIICNSVTVYGFKVTAKEA